MQHEEVPSWGQASPTKVINCLMTSRDIALLNGDNGDYNARL